MNPIAKRIYNIAPDPVRLTFEDGTTVDLAMRSAEFFQDDFQGEATSIADDTAYRLVTDGPNNESLIAGREVDGGWEHAGTVTKAEPLE
ncbi:MULTISPECIES: hypothetical protein [unclassified Haladaptatus]|uniref:hypothetical protein n=1 Tax=unclassified Haladaptatus TaxID=2622732 RepID=UPI0023E7DF56|nr:MULTISPECIES: hypothetical protein [unclassified Haladaptatus]